MVHSALFWCALAVVLAVATAQCSGGDSVCWSRISLGLANKIRSRNGMKGLTMGYASQQKNADNWAREIMNKGALVHQDLREASTKVSCGLLINAENIAYNYETGNIAAKCMDQWENSPPHLRNILNSNSDMMSVGFSRKGDGSMWCAMTMSMKMTSNPEGALCKPISGGSGGGGSGGGGNGGGGSGGGGSGGGGSGGSGMKPMTCGIEKSRMSKGMVTVKFTNRKKFDVKLWFRNVRGKKYLKKIIKRGTTYNVQSFAGASFRLTKMDNGCMRSIMIKPTKGTRQVLIGGF